MRTITPRNPCLGLGFLFVVNCRNVIKELTSYLSNSDNRGMNIIKDNEIVIPEEFNKDMKILSTVMSPVKEDIGILIMGENMEPEHYAEGLSVIRLYLLNKRNFKYHIEMELESFAFHDLESAYEFLIKLPDMSALELLIMMNSPKFDFDDGVNSNRILH